MAGLEGGGVGGDAGASGTGEGCFRCMNHFNLLMEVVVKLKHWGEGRVEMGGSWVELG